MRRYVMHSAALVVVLTTGYVLAQTDTNSDTARCACRAADGGGEGLRRDCTRFRETSDGSGILHDRCGQPVGGGRWRYGCERDQHFPRGRAGWRQAARRSGFGRSRKSSVRLCQRRAQHHASLAFPPICTASTMPATSLDELQYDNMTLQTLTGSGVEFLIRPQFRAQLIAQISGVEDVGREKLGAVDTRHFRLNLLDKRVFDLWFTTGEQPVLTKLVTTTSIPIDGERTFRLTTTGTFQWQVGVKHAEGTFALEIPAGARRVNDLLAALQEGDIEQLLGQPAPALELTNLQGNQVNLSQQFGKNSGGADFLGQLVCPEHGPDGVPQ